MKDDRSQVLGFIGVIVFVALVTILVLTSVRRPTDSPRVPIEERTTAHQLAIFQAGQYVEEDSKSVQEIEELLNSLSTLTISSKEEIGNLSTDTIIELKRDYDIELDITELLKKAKEIARESAPHASYEEIVAKVKIILSQEKAET